MKNALFIGQNIESCAHVLKMETKWTPVGHVTTFFLYVHLLVLDFYFPETALINEMSVSFYLK